MDKVGYTSYLVSDTKHNTRYGVPMMDQPAADTPPAIDWNDMTILDRAGGTPEAIQQILQTHRQGTPSRNAVQQWISRRHIPHSWVPRLVYALLAERKIETRDLFRLGSERRTAPVRPRRRRAA